MKNNCIVCRQSQRKLIRDRLKEKYFEAFNFYFAKPINELIASVPNTSHVIYFKDYVILDECQEYLKRFYNNEEVKPRIEILTEFYVTNYKLIHPNLIITDQHKQMIKRNNKMDKLFYQKMQQSEQSVKPDLNIENQVLNSKLTTNSCISYETDEHNIYNDANLVKTKSAIDLNGLKIIYNLKQLNASEIYEQNQQIDEQFEQCILQINSMTHKQSKLRKLPTQFYKSPQEFIKEVHTSKSIKRRTNQIDIRERKTMLMNSKSESKNGSSFKYSKLKDSVEQIPDDIQDFDTKPKLSRVHSDTSTIQKMLKDYQSLQRNRQLRQTISSDLLPGSTSSVIQGFQGQQKSLRQDQNNGSIHSSSSQKQEALKKVYQQLPQQQKKLTQNQLDKIARGGCLTERNTKRPLPISDEIMNKLQDIQTTQLKSVNNQQKQEFKYMIPSQYNASQAMKIINNKAKSTNSKKITSDLCVKSSHLSNNHSQYKQNPINQKTDEIVKKYIQFASQNMNNQKKKFDFKLNLQGLHSDHNMQEQSHEDTSSNRNNYLTERPPQQIVQEIYSHRKIVLK